MRGRDELLLVRVRVLEIAPQPSLLIRFRSPRRVPRMSRSSSLPLPLGACMAENFLKQAAPGKIEALENQVLTKLAIKPNSQWQTKIGRRVEDW